MSRPESGGRGVCSGFGVLIRSVERASLSSIVLTRCHQPNASDATFRACFGCELPRAEALGYDL